MKLEVFLSEFSLEELKRMLSIDLSPLIKQAKKNSKEFGFCSICKKVKPLFFINIYKNLKLLEWGQFCSIKCAQKYAKTILKSKPKIKFNHLENKIKVLLALLVPKRYLLRLNKAMFIKAIKSEVYEKHETEQI